MGTIPSSRRKLGVYILSKLAHLRSVRNSSSTPSGSRVTTRRGKRDIPIRAFCHGKLTLRPSRGSHRSPQDQLIKQTYSVWVPGVPSSRETRKWHLGEDRSDPRPCRVLIVASYVSQLPTLRLGLLDCLRRSTTTPPSLG